jgi:CheY-like chemotaxis protein
VEIMGHVLVVDDNPGMHQLYRVALQRTGYRLLTATSGSDALLVMGAHFPDLILLDLAMPDMDGFQFLRMLRQNKEYATVPVIVVTAFGTGEDLEATKGLGVVAHLVKADFSVKHLRATIAAHLAPAAARRAATTAA